jgi:hypothetical protein
MAAATWLLAAPAPARRRAAWPRWTSRPPRRCTRRCCSRAPRRCAPCTRTASACLWVTSTTWPTRIGAAGPLLGGCSWRAELAGGGGTRAGRWWLDAAVAGARRRGCGPAPAGGGPQGRGYASQCHCVTSSIPQHGETECSRHLELLSPSRALDAHGQTYSTPACRSPGSRIAQTADLPLSGSTPLCKLQALTPSSAARIEMRYNARTRALHPTLHLPESSNGLHSLIAATCQAACCSQGVLSAQ